MEEFRRQSQAGYEKRFVDEYHPVLAAIRAVKEHFPFPGKSVLLLAAGTGELVDLLRADGFRTLLSDKDGVLVAAARLAGRSPVRVVDAFNVPFKGKPVSIVVTDHFLASNYRRLDGIEQEQKIVTEIERVLRPGGILVMHNAQLINAINLLDCRKWEIVLAEKVKTQFSEELEDSKIVVARLK